MGLNGIAIYLHAPLIAVLKISVLLVISHIYNHHQWPNMSNEVTFNESYTLYEQKLKILRLLEIIHFFCAS